MSRVTLAKPRRVPLAAQRGDHHVRPEPRAVLADAPAFVLEAARRARRRRSSCSRPCRAMRLRRIEGREVLADDLVGGVALDALGAGVPGRDVAVRIEHEDRVVLHALDQQAEALLALRAAPLRRRGARSGRA